MHNDITKPLKTENISAWDDFLLCLPGNWREIVESSGVLKGQRKDKEPETLMHLLMLHLLCGYSLRETSAIADEANIASLSDVALLKRLRKSADMFRELCSAMFGEIRNSNDFAGYQIRLADWIIINEPGQFGTQWSLHYSFSLPDMTCDFFKLAKIAEPGLGEGLKNFALNPNDIIIENNGLCILNGLNHVADSGGYCCVRWNNGLFSFKNEDGGDFDLQSLFERLPIEGTCGEADIVIHDGNPEKRLPCRLCVIRKNDVAAERSRRILRAENSKKSEISQLELTACDFIVLLTTLPADTFSLKKVLELYRLSWQNNLVFKRFKSIVRIGALPKYTDSSAEAWLYGKMFVALMLERLSSRMGTLSPWRSVDSSSSEQKLVEQTQALVTPMLNKIPDRKPQRKAKK